MKTASRPNRAFVRYRVPRVRVEGAVQKPDHVAQDNNGNIRYYLCNADGTTTWTIAINVVMQNACSNSPCDDW